MDTFSLRYLKPQALITLCCLLAIGLASANSWTQGHWGISFSIFSVAGIFIFTMNQWWWKYYPFRLMYCVPDFSGTYEGQSHFDYKTQDNITVSGTMRHEKIIHQNGSAIVVNSWTFKEDGTLSSKSSSVVADVVLEKDGTYTIICNYFNHGDTSQRFSPFYGTEALKVVQRNGTNWLVGDYFTGRLPLQTRGRTEVEWKSTNTKHKN